MEMSPYMNYVLFALICVNLGVLCLFLILEAGAVRKRAAGKAASKPATPERTTEIAGKEGKRMQRQRKALLERADREDRVELGTLEDLGDLLSAAGGLDRHGKPLPGPAGIGRRSAGAGGGSVPA